MATTRDCPKPDCNGLCLKRIIKRNDNEKYDSIVWDCLKCGDQIAN